MHKAYAAYFNAVEIDFALNVRKSPIPLKKIKAEVRLVPPSMCKSGCGLHAGHENEKGDFLSHVWDHCCRLSCNAAKRAF